MTVSFVATDGDGEPWYFDVAGAFTSHRGGLLRTDAVWKALGRAVALQARPAETCRSSCSATNLPRRPSEGDTALRAAGTEAFFDVVDLLSEDGLDRLRRYAKGGCTDSPQPGFWTSRDVAANGAAQLFGSQPRPSLSPSSR